MYIVCGYYVCQVDNLYIVFGWVRHVATGVFGATETVRCVSFFRAHDLRTYLVAPPTACKWVITPVINGISRVNPLVTGVITHLRAVGSSPPSRELGEKSTNPLRLEHRIDCEKGWGSSAGMVRPKLGESVLGGGGGEWQISGVAKFFRGPVMPGSWAEIGLEFVRVLGNGCLADSSKEKRLVGCWLKSSNSTWQVTERTMQQLLELWQGSKLAWGSIWIIWIRFNWKRNFATGSTLGSSWNRTKLGAPHLSELSS